jgi:SAM-dependent methyltransferase
VYTLPRLPEDELYRMYQDDYWKSDSAKDFGYTDYLADAELYKKTFRMRSTMVRRHHSPGARMLDVGCAAGFALETFQELGYDVYGVEISKSMAAESGRKIGAERVHHGPLESNLFDGKRFDVITLWDVVEHVEDPIALLKLASSLLSENGILLIETQNVASLFARVMGLRWQHYKFQEHLYHFDPRTIRTLFEKAGLELVERTGRRGGKYVSLGFIVERAGRVHPVFTWLLSPLRLLSKQALYINLFDEMLVVARRAPGPATDG